MDSRLRTINVQWAQIRADLDRGTPAALGLVTVRSAKPADLAFNHQVLAYDYGQSAAEVTARVYDPNQGARDDICIPAAGTDPGGLSRRGPAVLVDNVIGHSGPPASRPLQADRVAQGRERPGRRVLTVAL